MNDPIALAIAAFREPEAIFLQATRDLVTHLLDTPNAAIAKWHPLGFVHISFAARDYTSLRLHIWPSSERREQAPLWTIHDHVFRLNSRIITGRVTNTEFTTEEVPTGNYQLYTVEYNNGISRLCRSSVSIAAAISGITTHCCGDTYTVPKGTFHTSDVRRGEFTSTFVIGADFDTQAKPRVLGAPDGLDTYEYLREQCSDEYTDTLLQTLLKKAAAPNSSGNLPGSTNGKAVDNHLPLY